MMILEVTNKFEGLNLIGRAPKEVWMDVHDTVQEEKKCKKTKRLSEEALQIAVKRREVKSKGEK